MLNYINLLLIIFFGCTCVLAHPLTVYPIQDPKESYVGVGVSLVSIIKGEQRVKAALKATSRSEIRITQNIPPHEHLMKFEGTDELSGGMVVEYVEGKSPSHANFLQLPQFSRIPSMRIILRQLASALRELEKNGIVHADVKIDNIVVANFFDFPQQRAVVIDFGNSFWIDRPESWPPCVGSNGYSAPEASNLKAVIDNKFDVFAFGQVISHMMSDGATTISDDGVFFAAGIELGANPSELKDALDLLRKCLRPNPIKRITFDDILLHPFITGVGHTDYEPQINMASFWENMNNEIRQSIVMKANQSIALTEAAHLPRVEYHRQIRDIWEKIESEAKQPIYQKYRDLLIKQEITNVFTRWVKGPQSVPDEYVPDQLKF